VAQEDLQVGEEQVRRGQAGAGRAGAQGVVAIGERGGADDDLPDRPGQLVERRRVRTEEGQDVAAGFHGVASAGAIGGACCAARRACSAFAE
jgi:hypothetical protein